jgi:hypothetical protein
LRGIVWLAAATNRSLLIPNIPYANLQNSAVRFLNATPSGSFLWPGFRVAYRFPTFPVEVVEPSYYWRIETDYLLPTPAPHIVTTNNSDSTLSSLLSLLSLHQHRPRVVLSIAPTTAGAAAVARWAVSSGEQELSESLGFKFPSRGMLQESTEGLLDIRLCRNIFLRPRGNRSCFDKCK